MDVRCRCLGDTVQTVFRRLLSSEALVIWLDGILDSEPVLITVGATVFGLFPLAADRGPLWEPLCYAQIRGLAAATFTTLLLVPVLYANCALDLKIVKWGERTVAPDGTRITNQENGFSTRTRPYRWPSFKSSE